MYKRQGAAVVASKLRGRAQCSDCSLYRHAISVDDKYVVGMGNYSIIPYPIHFTIESAAKIERKPQII